jgi:hypothetical protein
LHLQGIQSCREYRGVTPDGQEFLLRSTAASQTTSINVVLNWPAAMKEGRQ